MRAAVLHLAFAGLGATDAVSALSTTTCHRCGFREKLGYQPDGIERLAARGRVTTTRRLPAFVSVARGRARLFLSEHRGDARPDALVHLTVSDVNAVLAEFGRPAGDPPYGCEFELRDPDGNRLRIRRPETAAPIIVGRHDPPEGISGPR